MAHPIIEIFLDSMGARLLESRSQEELTNPSILCDSVQSKFAKWLEVCEHWIYQISSAELPKMKKFCCFVATKVVD